jgi:D-alanyl-D-alanine carboxypeptidase/D-alanyl-D-alanine-endopeptidase (penicillin-binding protein 4)
VLTTHYSPSLDSIIYWFLKKSINLYGEALIKTFAYEKDGFGSTDSGVAIVKKFWKQKGLDEDELNIRDGSGLSPLNRVTTHAQVEILKYAKTKDWFPHFYDALPEYNGMKMKSGTISDAKAFCGYQKSKDGKEYIFSFIINNYNGPSSGVVNKMYKVLDLLK